MALWTNVDEEAGKPKFLSAADKAATLGISADEASNVNGTHAGWVLSKSGTGGRSGRTSRETLVAMGSITGDNDSVDPDPVITIDTQPIAVIVTEPAAATFTVEASVTRGGTATYQWEVSTDNGTSWTEIEDETDDTLVIDPTAVALNNNEYRVVVSATGATPVTSDEVALTVNGA
jgi:hypothetical protein